MRRFPWSPLALLAVLLLSVVPRAEAQVTLTATFTRGAIAQYTSNSNQTNTGQLFGTLNIASIGISQVSGNGTWGGTQGNDTSVDVTITFNNTSTVTFPGAINWVKNAGGGVFEWVGITTNQVVADGYTATGGSQKTYILQFDQSSLNLSTLLPDNLDGSANAGQALSALNTYVPPPAISFTNTNTTISGQPAYSFTCSENRATGATLGTVSASGGGGTLSYSITAGNGSGWFAINSSTGVITVTSTGAGAAANDFEASPNTHTLTVQATDGTSPVTITVSLNESNLDDTAPQITGPSGGAGAASSAISVNENQTAVTQFTANEAVTWTISGGVDAARFALAANGTLTFQAAPDYEVPTDADTNNVYVLVIRATDGAGNISTQTVSVTVLNLDDTAPQITGPSGGAGAATSAISVNENQTAVTQLSANEAVTWSISGGTDAARFSIATNGTLTFLVAPDFEAPTDSDTNNTYVLVVRAVDGTGNISTQTVTVTVLDLDDTAPQITGPSGGAGAATSAISVNENQTAVTQLSANEAVTWSISGGTDAARFSIAANGTVTFLVAPDFEVPTDSDTNRTYVFVAHAVDGAGNISTQTVTVTVLDINDADPPAVITGPSGGAGAATSAISVNENQTAVTQLSANEAVTWSISGGTDAGRFAIAADGTIIFNAAPDYEVPNDSDTNNTYVLIVRAVDGGGNVSTQTVTVTVLDLDDTAPQITGPSGGAGAAASALLVNENQTAVTQLSADEAVTWSISGGTDAGRFTISADGTITFNAAPDFEVPADSDTNNTYLLVIRAVDGGGNISNQTITVTVLDLADTIDPPAVITGPSGGAGAPTAALSVNEGQQAVARLAASESVTWSISGGTDPARFSIAADGTITFNAAPDFEAPSDSDTNNTYVLVLRALDAGGNATFQTLTVTVLDVVDTAPLITGPSGGPGAASSAMMLNEGLLPVTQFTANRTVTWAIAGGADAGRFSIATDGSIAFLAATDYEHPADANQDNQYLVQLRATDGAGNMALQMLAVTVADLAEVEQKIAEISGALRGDLRNYAFGSLQDMLAFNEGLMAGSSADSCDSGSGRRRLSATANHNQNAGLRFSQQIDCAATTRIYLDAGLSASKRDGNLNTRGMAALRVERDFSSGLMLGAGLLGTQADDRLNTFTDSRISDHSLQVNVYGRSHLTPQLQLSGFLSTGRAWYDFSLRSDGLALQGDMTGHRSAYGVTLTGDIPWRDNQITTEIALSHSLEKLAHATLDGQYLGESRSGLYFAVGGVNATRLSVPVHVPLVLKNDAAIGGGTARLALSPGLLCEDTSAGDSSLSCGYQLGARLQYVPRQRDRLNLDLHHEVVNGTRRDSGSVGFAHRLGATSGAELDVALNQDLGGAMRDTRVYIQLRVPEL